MIDWTKPIFDRHGRKLVWDLLSGGERVVWLAANQPTVENDFFATHGSNRGGRVYGANGYHLYHSSDVRSVISNEERKTMKIDPNKPMQLSNGVLCTLVGYTDSEVAVKFNSGCDVIRVFRRSDGVNIMAVATGDRAGYHNLENAPEIIERLYVVHAGSGYPADGGKVFAPGTRVVKIRFENGKVVSAEPHNTGV